MQNILAATEGPIVGAGRSESLEASGGRVPTIDPGEGKPDWNDNKGEGLVVKRVSKTGTCQRDKTRGKGEAPQCMPNQNDAGANIGG